MTTKSTKAPSDTKPAPSADGDGDGDAADVEGHNLWVNPSASREMTNSRSRDIEREARERQRAKDAKANKGR